MLAIGCLPYVYQYLYGEMLLSTGDTTVLLFLSIFAAVFGAGVYFLRGPDEVVEHPLHDQLRAVLRPGGSRWAVSSWSALGTVLWILGLAMGLLNWAVDYAGLANAFGLSRGIGWVEFVIRSGGETAFGLVLFGAVCVVFGRLGQGVWAGVRDSVAQVALLQSVYLLFQVATGGLSGTDGPVTLAVLVFILGGGLLGLFLMLRPSAARPLALQADLVSVDAPEAEKAVAGGKEA